MKKTLKKFLFVILLLLMLTFSAGCLGNCFGSSEVQNNNNNNSNNSTATHTCSYGEWKIETPATCTEEGTKIRSCSCGKFQTEKIELLPHIRGEAIKENIIDATCLSIGSCDLNYYCIECNKLLSTEKQEIDYAEHTLTDVRGTGNYCGDREISAVYCSVCGEFITSFGHNYKKTVISATCTENGSIHFSCLYCNDSYNALIPASGHVESDFVIITVPGCESEGLALKKCLICAEVTEKKQISATDHTYVSSKTDSGILYSCKNCSHSYTLETEKELYSVSYLSENNTVSSITLSDGEKITYFPEVEKEGFTLRYWATDPEGKNPYSSQPVYADTYLYAIFEKDVIVNTEKSDISAFSSVPENFIFSVYGKDSEYVRQNLSLYSIGGEELPYTLSATDGGCFEVSADYVSGNHYYAKATGDVCFIGTEKKEIQFSVAGENRTDLVLESSVKMLNAKDVYLILDTEDGKCLLTNEEFAVGGNVAVYENDEENILFVLKVISKDVLMDRNAYIFDAADYAAAFEKLDVSISGSLKDSEIELNSSAVQVIEAELLKSDFYMAAKTSAVMLAEKNGFELDFGDIKASLATNDGKVIVNFGFSFDFKDKFTIEFMCRNVLEASFDYNMDSLSSYSTILTTTNTFNFQISFSEAYSLSSPSNIFTEGGADKSYLSLLEEFKESFNETRQLLSAGRKSSAPKDCLIGRVTLQISWVTVTFDIGIRFDFDVSGTVGINTSVTVTNTVGIRNGTLLDSFDIALTGLYAYGVGKLEFAIQATAELFISIAGIGVYGNINAGPYLEVGVAGSIGYDGSKLFVPRASVYIDSGLRFDANVGLKGELLGVKIFDIGINIPIKETHLSDMPLGSKEIYIDFLHNEKEIEYGAMCDQSYVLDLNTMISTEITYQDVEDMSVGNKIPENVFFSISSISGYASKITLKGSKLYFNDVVGTVVLDITVKFSDSIYKVVKFTYSVEHTDTCIHITCTDDTHRGGVTTCTDRAICVRCGQEYGPEVDGHNNVNGVCVDCGEVLESIGLAYSQLQDGTYEVLGIGSCEGTRIVIPEKHDGIPVTAIGNEAFMGNTSITSITIPKTITRIGHDAFMSCSALTEIKFNAENLLPNSDYPYSSNSMFYGAGTSGSGITVIIGKTVESIPENFLDGIYSVKTVIFEKDSNCTKIGACAFSGCTKLSEITVPESVKRIEKNTFYSCSKLLSITLGSSVEFIGERAFHGCSSLKKINIASTVNYIGPGAFDYCKALEFTEYSNACYIGNEANPYFVLIKAKDQRITSCDISEKTVFIYEKAFESCGALESISIPDSVTIIGVEAFYKCSSLRTVSIGKSTKIISHHAFAYCTSLSNLSFAPDAAVEVIDDNAFYNANYLKNVTLADSLIKIGYSNFDSAAYLTYNEYGNALYIGSSTNPYLVLAKAKNTSITSCEVHGDTKFILYNAFKDCKYLTQVSVPDSLIYVGASAFLSCDRIKYNEYEGGCYLGNESNPYIIFMKPKSLSVTEISLHNDTKFIYSNAFQDATKLKKVNIGPSLIGIGWWAFGGCTALESINIPSSTVYIESYAFRECDSLRTVFFPESVKIFGSEVFCYCDNITAVYWEADTTPIYWVNSTYNATNKYIFGYKNNQN